MSALRFVAAGLGFLLATPAAAQDSFGGAGQQTSPGYGQELPIYGQQQQTPQGFGQPQSPTATPPSIGQPQQGQGFAGEGHLDQLARAETEDYGVPPVTTLHHGPMHGPTPARIPGGQVITTKGVIELLRGRQAPFILLDILGGPEVIPGAVPAVAAHRPGDFNDEIQRAFGGFLHQITAGNVEMPIVLYCQSSYCWMSYNASLRAINLGYRNVLWYRGGLEAWKYGGQQTQAY